MGRCGSSGHQPITPGLCPWLLSSFSRQTREPAKHAEIYALGPPGWVFLALQTAYCTLLQVSTSGMSNGLNQLAELQPVDLNTCTHLQGLEELGSLSKYTISRGWIWSGHLVKFHRNYYMQSKLLERSTKEEECSSSQTQLGRFNNFK